MTPSEEEAQRCAERVFCPCNGNCPHLQQRDYEEESDWGSKEG